MLESVLLFILIAVHTSQKKKILIRRSHTHTYVLVLWTAVSTGHQRIRRDIREYTQQPTVKSSPMAFYLQKLSFTMTHMKMILMLSNIQKKKKKIISDFTR